MITKDNFKEVLTNLGFQDSGDSFTKEFKELDTHLKVDFKKRTARLSRRQGIESK
ncbi:MAG: hypothetical protein AAGC64_12375 [Bacteroidota bacterium]